MASKLIRIRDKDIRAALTTLNAKRGLASGQVGYAYYADIKGDGRNVRRVWTVISANGGVTYSHMNGATQRKTLEKINKSIEEA